MKRRLLFATLAALIGTVATAFGLLFYTSAGLHWALGQIEARAGGALHIGSAQGRLAGPLELHELRIDAARTRLSIARIALDWRAGALLLGRVHVLDADVSGVDITLAEGSAGTTPALPGPLTLPVALRVDHLAVHDAALRKGTDTLLKLDSATLAGRSSARQLTLARLAAQGPGFDVRARGTLGALSKHRVHLTADYHLQPPGLAPLVGTLAVDGDLTALRLHQQLSAPAKVKLQADVSDPFTHPTFSAELQLATTPLAEIAPGAPTTALGARLKFHGDTQHLRVAGELITPDTLAGRIDTQGAFATTDDRLTVQSLQFITEGQTRLDLTGVVPLAAGSHDALDIKAQWRDLRWPLLGGHSFPLGDGTAEVRGKDGGYATNLDATLLRGTLKGTATLATRSRPAAKASLRWSGIHFAFGGRPISLPAGSLTAAGDDLATYAAQLDTQATVDGTAAHLALVAKPAPHGIALDSIRLHTLGGRVSGTAGLDWRAGLSARWRLRADDLDPGKRWPDWPGRVDFALDGTSASRRESTSLHARLSALGGQLHGQDLSGHAGITLADGQWTIEQAQVKVGPNQVLANGGLRQPAGLHWRIDIDDAARLAKDAHGRLVAKGTVKSQGGALALEADARSENLALADIKIKSLQAQAAFDTTLTEPVRLHLDLKNLEAGDLRIHSASLAVQGPASAQTLVAAIDSDHGTARIDGRGSLANRHLSFDLQRADLTAPDAGAWHLEKPARLVLDMTQQRLAGACWRSDSAVFCTDAHRDSDGWQVDSRLQALPLALPGRLLPETLALSGTLSGEIHAQGSAEKPGQVTLDLTSAGGKLQHGDDKQQLDLLDFSSAALHGTLDAQQLTAKLDLALADGGFIHGNVDTRLAGTPGQRPLRASLRARIDDLGLLPVLVPELGSLDGHLDADLQLAGTQAEPELTGSASLEDGTAGLPRLGIRLDHLGARLTGTGSGLRVELGADSGGGKLALTADATRAGDSWQAHGKITGENFQALDIPEATVWVSPAMDISAVNHHLDVTGTLTVPKARLAPRDLSGTVQVSPDQVIVDPGAASAPRWRISADVRTRLGDAVHFDGFGLSGLIQGAVHLREQPGQLTTGSGELAIADGKYKAYGQQLDIAHGRLLFSGGPVTEPGLDIRATRSAGEVTAGVDIRGTLRAPKLSVFSDPSMPQSQAMSYLLLGHGLNETSTSEQNTLNNAAVAVGGELLAQQLNRRLGFGEVSVENGSTTGETSLFLGKYLSPRLYIGYGVGLYQQLSLFKVRYELSKKWTLQAESGTRSSADLLYTIER